MDASQDRWECNRFIGLQAGGKWKQVLFSSYLTEGWNKKYQNDWDWIGFCAYRPYSKLCSRSEECLWEADQLPVVNSVSGMIYSPVKEVNILNNKWRRRTNKKKWDERQETGSNKIFGFIANSQRDLGQSHQDRSFLFLMLWSFFLNAFLCDSTEEIYLLFSPSSRAGPCSPLIPWTRVSSEGV